METIDYANVQSEALAMDLEAIAMIQLLERREDEEIYLPLY